MTWAPEATPKNPEDARRGPAHPEIVADAVRRGIASIVHFTRTTGLLGILDSSAVKARLHLPRDARVKHVYEENATDRSRDLVWHGYINLSVSAINRRMFAFSKREHPDDEWVILKFRPQILGDPGVVFCTTNNAYEVAHRGEGYEGYEQMFAPSVPWGHYGSVRNRYGREPNQTTDPQAEVLYPFELSLEHLHTIGVSDEDTYDTVWAALSHFSHRPNLALAPEEFE
jgi:hypothetical protein